MSGGMLALVAVRLTECPATLLSRRLRLERGHGVSLYLLSFIIASERL
jgi:hypothetical protein